MKFCCFDFNQVYGEQKLRIRHEPYSREFALQVFGGRSYQQLLYCFCCGNKFSEGLREIWYSILTEEYQIEDPWEAKYEGTLPLEFMTDEWWKKRDL